MGNLTANLEDQNSNRKVDGKGQAHKVSCGMRTVLETELEAIHVTFWKRLCQHIVHDRQAEIKINGLINLVGKFHNS
jgi:hypothetical protein